MVLAKQFEQPIEKHRYAESEYFEIERTAEGRWEYVNGHIRMMAGGSDDHAMISSNIGRLLGNALVPRGCRVYVDNMKLHTGDGVNTFPDVSVVCGERQYYLGKDHVIINPLLIVEVLSPSTRDYDQGDKFRHYQTIDSLQEYLMVEPDTPAVRLYTRREDYWEFREIVGLNRTVTLQSVEVTLALTDIYALIEFQEEPKTEL
jgi:Uma2 family endonuclease